MSQKNRTLLRNITLFILLAIGIWNIRIGNISDGAGLLGAGVAAYTITTIKHKRLRQAQDQGINPLDERTWTIAGRAAYAAYLTFVGLAVCIILLGSILGPQTLVNPYDLLGICIALLVLFYICFFYYYNHKM